MKPRDDLDLALKALMKKQSKSRPPLPFTETEFEAVRKMVQRDVQGDADPEPKPVLLSWRGRKAYEFLQHLFRPGYLAPIAVVSTLPQIALPSLMRPKQDFWELQLYPANSKGQTTGQTNSALNALIPNAAKVLPIFSKSTIRIRLADTSLLAGELKLDSDTPLDENDRLFYASFVKGKTKSGEPVEARVKLEFKPVSTNFTAANLTTNDIRWAKVDVTLWNSKDTNTTVHFVREGIFVQ